VTGAGPVARAAELAALGHRSSLSRTDVARLEDASAADPDARVRAASLAALVRGGSAGARAAWNRGVLDVAPAVRRRAAELGPALEPPAPVDELLALLGDADVTVVEAAAWAVGELGDEMEMAGAVTALGDTVTNHRDALAREAAVAALGALGDPSALPVILAACTDKPAVRRRAVLALAPFDGPEVDAAITAALQDRDWQVRQAAEDMLGEDHVCR
jgi:HEAT repeat protein